MVHTSLVHSSYGQFGHWLIRPYGLFNPDPKNSALVNSVPDHLSVRTFLLVNSDRKKKISLVNSDLFHWSIRTFSIGQFGPFPLINSDLFQCSVRTLNRFWHWLIRTMFPKKKSDLYLIRTLANPNQVRIGKGPNYPKSELSTYHTFVPRRYFCRGSNCLWFGVDFCAVCTLCAFCNFS